MQIPKSNVTPMVRTAPVDPKFLMMAAAMMKGEGKLNPKLDPKDVEASAGQPSGSRLQLAQSPLQPAGGPSMQPSRSARSGLRTPGPGAVLGSSGT